MREVGREFRGEVAPPIGAKDAARAALLKLRTAPERNWSQSELARRLNTTPTQVRKLENGDLNISLDWLERIARVLGVKMSAFLPADEVEIEADPATTEVLNVLNDLEPDDRVLMAQAAKNMLRIARQLGTAEKGPGLHGDYQLAERVADRWNSWSEQQRRRAADLLLMAEGLSAP